MPRWRGFLFETQEFRRVRKFDFGNYQFLKTFELFNPNGEF